MFTYNTMQSNQTGDEAAMAARVEGARYALLRRLAPAMRHHLVVNLQPIGMIYEVMERRLQADSPDLAQIRDGASRINGFSRAAVRSCLDVMTWLSPEAGATSTVAEAVEECLGLLNSNFNFRGFSITSDVAQGDAQDMAVARSAIRHVLTGAMLACTDALAQPADVVLGATLTETGAVLSIRLSDAAGREGFPHDDAYRHLTWVDVEAIAEAEGVTVTHGPGLVELAFTAVTPTVPLTVD